MVASIQAQFPQSRIVGKFSCSFRKPRLQGDTLQGHNWLASDSEDIVILATPVLPFLVSAADEKTIRK